LAVGGGHVALQHERLVSACGQQGGEDFYVRDPSGEHEAVAPAPQRGRDVGDDLAVACGVRDQSAVHFGERTGRGQVDIVGAEFGLVDVEQASWSRLGRPEVDEGVLTVAEHSAVVSGFVSLVMVRRAGPSCQVTSSSSPRRTGVAVSPSQNWAPIRLTEWS
jgi:hypothetical protein